MSGQTGITDASDYSVAWRDLRKRRLLLWGLFFGYIPGVLLFCFVIGAPVSVIFGKNSRDTVCTASALLWMAAWAVAIIRHALFRCPQCHGTFCWTWFWSNPFTSKCLHCGLRRGDGSSKEYKAGNSSLNGSLAYGNDPLPILRRAGTVLIVIGLIDIAFMIYCIINRISYASSLNVFAVIAGVFLYRGNLRAALGIRVLATFFFAAFLAMLPALSLLEPIGLTIARFRQHPLTLGSLTILAVLLIFSLWWIMNELGREPVLNACRAAGQRIKSRRLPAILGVVIVVVLVAILTIIRESGAAKHAVDIASGDLGLGYNYFVSSLSFAATTKGTAYSATVTAWNGNEIREIAVRWQSATESH